MSLPEDWDPTSDRRRIAVWEVTQHLIRRLEDGGEPAAGALLRRLGGLGRLGTAARVPAVLDLREDGWRTPGPFNALVAVVAGDPGLRAQLTEPIGTAEQQSRSILEENGRWRSETRTIGKTRVGRGVRALGARPRSRSSIGHGERSTQKGEDWAEEFVRRARQMPAGILDLDPSVPAQRHAERWYARFERQLPRSSPATCCSRAAGRSQRLGAQPVDSATTTPSSTLQRRSDAAGGDRRRGGRRRQVARRTEPIRSLETAARTSERRGRRPTSLDAPSQG